MNEIYKKSRTNSFTVVKHAPITKMLLHACCGPCSLEPVRLLQERGIFPVIYYANSNIHPREEYKRRLATLQAWAHGGKSESSKCETLHKWANSDKPKCVQATCEAENAFSAPTRTTDDTTGSALLSSTWPAKCSADPALLAPVRVIEGTYNPTLWEEAIDMRSREARCRTCYRLRFAECAEYAVAHGFDTIGTTLSVSPYQYTQIIREELERAATTHGLQEFFEDYTPYYAQATRRSRALGMYRQNYCGCRISEAEAEAERAQRKQEREVAKQQKKAQKEQYAREHAQEIAAIEQAREARKRERTAYAQKQARKKQILKQLRQQRAD